jgi:hypothetical protein
MTTSPLQALHYIASTAPRADSRGRRCCMCAAHIDLARDAIGFPRLPAPYLPRTAPSLPMVTPAGIDALATFADQAEADGRQVMISPAQLRELIAKARPVPAVPPPAGKLGSITLGEFTITQEHCSPAVILTVQRAGKVPSPHDDFRPLALAAFAYIQQMRAVQAEQRSQLEGLREGKIPRLQAEVDSAFAQRNAVVRQRDEARNNVAELTSVLGAVLRIGREQWWSEQWEKESPEALQIRLASAMLALYPKPGPIGTCETCSTAIQEGDKWHLWEDGVMTCEKHGPTPEEIAESEAQASTATSLQSQNR